MKASPVFLLSGTIYFYMMNHNGNFMKISDMRPEERPREKLAGKGAKTLDNPELLAIILRTGTGQKNALDIARDLLASADNRLAELADFSMEKMQETKGIGLDKAVTVAAAMELGKRFVYEKNARKRESITGAGQIFRIMFPLMKGLSHEECWIFFLNRANYIIGKEQISSGGMSATVLDIKIILRKALEKKAHGIILVHNHPSGNPMPGSNDIVQTKNLKKAAETFDISLIDHIIIADDRYYSFADEAVSLGR